MRKFAFIHPGPPTKKEVEMALEQCVELIHVQTNNYFGFTFDKCKELASNFSGIVCNHPYAALAFICHCDVGIFQYSDSAANCGLRIFPAHTIVIEKSSYKPF